MTTTTTPLTKLDGLLGHLSACTGLYAKETFVSLYSCITKVIRDHRLRGVVLTRTLGDESLEAMATALKTLPDVSFFQFDRPGLLPLSSGLSDRTGLLVAVTDRFCATLYWTDQTRETFRLSDGGWTFHPADTRTLATHLVSHLADAELSASLMALIQATEVDRRYDDKLTVLITSLVNGLETRNRELTLALAQVSTLNQRMVDTERLAAIGQLCAVIAHEIRNPLGLIQLYAKLVETQVSQLNLGEATTRDPLLKNLSLIRESSESLEAILSELTDYSRPLTLNLQALDLRPWVRDVCRFVLPSYQERGVALVCPEGPDGEEPLVVQADPGRLKQALLNLLKNALEASPATTTVTVSVASRRGESQVYLKVADQGSGVPPAALGRLFTPYFSTKGNGTGLGLAHSRKILQAHGGSVDLVSNGAEGATFALILPRGSGEGN